MKNEDKKQLLQRAHQLHPVVMLGQKGLTASVGLEIERALAAHELIKIKVAGADREERMSVFEQISRDHQAELLKHIGFIGIFYRKNPDKVVTQ
jgi:RNA-binding protein